jgi:rhodanese-related sulfurtransferase
MLATFMVIGTITLAGVTALIWKKRNDRKRELRNHSISPETLHGLLEDGASIKLLDVRLPLDLLAFSETLPGATWIAPSEIIANPGMLSKDDDYVLYCTCPGDTSSSTVLEAALGMGFSRVKVLAGGIDGWKESGYPTVPYDRSFHLDN